MLERMNAEKKNLDYVEYVFRLHEISCKVYS